MARTLHKIQSVRIAIPVGGAQRPLASALTTIAMGLGVALVVAVLVIYAVVDQSFRQGGEGYDLIVGAKGGQLQLVLNSVYYLSRTKSTRTTSCSPGIACCIHRRHHCIAECRPTAPTRSCSLSASNGCEGP